MQAWLLSVKINGQLTWLHFVGCSFQVVRSKSVKDGPAYSLLGQSPSPSTFCGRNLLIICGKCIPSPTEGVTGLYS